jgi:16S rRNA (uracil1498-N3)-methyltransferase
LNRNLSQPFSISAVQLFYATAIENGFAQLDEEESRHLLQVLRRQVGDRLRLTDGRGWFYDGEIAEAGKKRALVRILERQEAPPERRGRLHLAIAPTKQIERIEWFLEKATEIGVDEITPLLCRRSERTAVRHDRLEKVLISAMKQSLRARLPVLNQLTAFTDFVKKTGESQKLLAWCADPPLPHLKTLLLPDRDVVIAIGPEGDFSPEEIELALRYGFAGAGLGAARLRTETAGLLAVAVMNLFGS